MSTLLLFGIFGSSIFAIIKGIYASENTWRLMHILTFFAEKALRFLHLSFNDTSHELCLHQLWIMIAHTVLAARKMLPGQIRLSEWNARSLNRSRASRRILEWILLITTDFDLFSHFRRFAIPSWRGIDEARNVSDTDPYSSSISSKCKTSLPLLAVEIERWNPDK